MPRKPTEAKESLGLKQPTTKRRRKMKTFTNITRIAAMSAIAAIGISLYACEKKEEKAAKPTEAAEQAPQETPEPAAEQTAAAEEQESSRNDSLFSDTSSFKVKDGVYEIVNVSYGLPHKDEYGNIVMDNIAKYTTTIKPKEGGKQAIASIKTEYYERATPYKLLMSKDSSYSFADTISPKVKGTSFSGEDVASFQILSSRRGEYKTVEVDYKVVSIMPAGYNRTGNFVAKYTKTATGYMGDFDCYSWDVKVEIYDFAEPSKLVMTIDKNCGRLDLDNYAYVAEYYSCGDMSGSYEIFDYRHRPIIDMSGIIIFGDIPSSAANIYKIYFGAASLESDYTASLYYAYNSTDRYTVKIGNNGLEECGIISDYYGPPSIQILSKNAEDKFDEERGRYTFNSLKGLKSKDSINNIAIRVTLPCGNTEFRDIVFDIPIINGKPFGKDQKTQEISIEELAAYARKAIAGRWMYDNRVVAELRSDGISIRYDSDGDSYNDTTTYTVRGDSVFFGESSSEKFKFELKGDDTLIMIDKGDRRIFKRAEN
jgi:hypothetical protein